MIPENGPRPGDGRDVQDLPGRSVQPQQPAGRPATGGQQAVELAGDGQRVLQPEQGAGRQIDPNGTIGPNGRRLWNTSET